jgi:phosphoglycolate phosphatase-like HAD superfamily hydrolase
MKKLLVLFDIDGTLLYSASMKYRHRFIHAIEKIHGETPTFEWEYLEGMIDHSILLHGLSQTSVDPVLHQQSLPQLHEAAYEYFIENISEEEYAQTILPGAKELLEKLKDIVHLGVLTGNYEKTAWKKLEYVGLRDYFDFGLFGHEAETRNQLAQQAQQKAKQHFGVAFHHEQIVFVGDTPRDIECARIIDAHVIAVATGKYSTETLKHYNPDILVESLDDPLILRYIEEINTSHVNNR